MAEKKPARINGRDTLLIGDGGVRPPPQRPVSGEAPLALYLPIADYAPSVGDFVIWTGWVNTWYGTVMSVADDGLTVEITFEKLPVLLFTMTPDEIDDNKRNRVIPVYRIRGERTGTWAVQKHDKTKNASIWFV